MGIGNVASINRLILYNKSVTPDAMPSESAVGSGDTDGNGVFNLASPEDGGITFPSVSTF